MMYSISQVILMQLLCFFIVYNSSGAINYLKHWFLSFNELIKFYQFICENNPILLTYYDDDSKDENIPDTNNRQVVEQPKQIPVKYEDKYLAKFKVFPNEFRFTDLEFKQENEEYEKINLDYDKTRLDTINAIQKQLFNIHEFLNEMQEKGNISHEPDKFTNNFTENINNDGINMILKFYHIEEEYDDDPDDFDIEELYQDVLKHKEVLLKKLDETEKMIMTEAELRVKARNAIINKKLDKYMDNYILEHTPLGNIFMRYNNDKKSFEYFSNNTMPYRYLEPVGRKYVMTYWCKPIFVDIEDELKRAEIRFDADKKKKEEENKKRQEEIKNNPKDVMARMKGYNKETKSKTIMQQPIKNRSSNNVLPPQIKANLPNVNQHSEKQLLKEQANRYTWEGRLTSFSLLKKIDKKESNKNLLLSYADFKRMQQDDKNKK